MGYICYTGTSISVFCLRDKTGEPAGMRYALLMENRCFVGQVFPKLCWILCFSFFICFYKNCFGVLSLHCVESSEGRGPLQSPAAGLHQSAGAKGVEEPLYMCHTKAVTV